jgi:hypothetical protein
MELRDVVDALSARFGSEAVAEEDGTFTVEVETDDGDRVLVSVYTDDIEDGPAGGLTVLMLRASAGEEIDAVEDPLALLEAASTTWFTRTYFESETTSLVAEAALPLDGISVPLVECAAQEVAELAVSVLDLVGEEYDEEDADEDAD